MKWTPARSNTALAALLGTVLAAVVMAAEHPLTALEFRNSGIVRRDMQFRYFERTVRYAEDPENWNVPGRMMYLYQVAGGTRTDPPAGMRSAVPLGGLGSGTVELRADGGFRDWNIFNNSPASGSPVQLDGALFGIRVQKGGAVSSSSLRTYPPGGLPAIFQIEYSGAFPVSRLRFSDPALPVAVDLYAYSEFYPRNADLSATPAAIFTFLLRNPTRDTLETSLLFAIPNYTGGQRTADASLTFRRDGDGPLSGTIALRAVDGTAITAAAASNLGNLWSEFSRSGSLTGAAMPGESPRYGAVTAAVALRPGEVRAVTFVLAWYLPFRRHMSQTPGNYYAKLYGDAGQVAEAVLNRLPVTWRTIDAWQKTIFKNSLPEWLQDALMNSVATMYKTGIRFGDGRWRQWESFSCANMEPEHIHLYRSLPYAFLFPDLQKQLLSATAKFQQQDGFVQEQLATGCFAPDSELDVPGGRQMADSAADLLLEAWQIWAWGADREYLSAIWPKVKKAAEWQIHRSETYGLPAHLENTYDWWDFGGKDLVSYNAILHLAAMRAAEHLALAENDAMFAAECHKAFATGQKSLYEHLWTGKYLRSWWMDRKPFPDALHADTLYGQLWAFLLDLGLTAEESMLKSHVASEAALNGSPAGLRVMRGADPGHPAAENGVQTSPDETPAARDNLVWEAGSLDWCSLNMYLGGGVPESLAEAGKIVHQWRDKLHDQWNYTDLTTAWDGYPWCNSHYSRQLILWSIPLALSGQRWYAPAKSLSFSPRPGAPTRMPFFTPQADGIIESLENGKWRLTISRGYLDLRELQAGSHRRTGVISLRAGEVVEF